MKMYIKIRNVFGNDLIYPACETARLFADLTGKSTFNVRDLNNIKDLGYTIEQKLDVELDSLVNSVSRN